MKPRHKRIIFVAIAVLAVSLASILITKALRSNMAYFFSPTQISNGEAPTDKLLRIGGLVKEGSLIQIGDGLERQFIVTDTIADTTVSYTGILPDLFKEGQGVVAKGRLQQDNIFKADEVLAKHDEKYLPPEAADALEAARTLKQ